MFYCSEAVKYLPDFEDIIKFETYAGPTGEGRLSYTWYKYAGMYARINECMAVGMIGDIPGAKLSEETVRAAANLDDTISTLGSQNWFTQYRHAMYTYINVDWPQILYSFCNKSEELWRRQRLLQSTGQHIPVRPAHRGQRPPQDLLHHRSGRPTALWF